MHTTGFMRLSTFVRDLPVQMCRRSGGAMRGRAVRRSGPRVPAPELWCILSGHMHPMSNVFAAPWDMRLRIWTPLVCTVFVLVVLIAPWRPAFLLAIKGIPVLVTVAVLAYAPKGYRLDHDYLIVKRLIGDLRISLVGLSRARRIMPDELRGAVRNWAVGCFFGYFGRFLVGVENQTWYVTDTQKCVRLDCPAGVFVVSPHDPEAFLSVLPPCEPGTATT